MIKQRKLPNCLTWYNTISRFAHSFIHLCVLTYNISLISFSFTFVTLHICPHILFLCFYSYTLFTFLCFLRFIHAFIAIVYRFFLRFALCKLYNALTSRELVSAFLFIIRLRLNLYMSSVLPYDYFNHQLMHRTFCKKEVF